MRHAILCVLVLGTTTMVASAALPQTTAEAFAAMQWDDTHFGEELSLADYHLTFEDEFNVLSVTADPGKGPWFAPVHSPFGAGTMPPPEPDGPFSVADGKLMIAGKKDAKGEWTSGTMQTVDGKGRGFAQQYGYFEMTYGVMITPEWIIMDYDRKELTRFRTLPEHRTPHYMLVSRAIEPNQPTATSPKIMKVDYVRAYATKGAPWDEH